MLPFELTKDTPYLALSGELWSVFYEYFNINGSCYKGFLLYYPLDWRHKLPFISGGNTAATDAFDMVFINILCLDTFY